MGGYGFFNEDFGSVHDVFELLLLDEVLSGVKGGFEVTEDGLCLLGDFLEEILNSGGG